MTPEEATAWVRERHRHAGFGPWCFWEGLDYPCPIIQALDAAIADAERWRAQAGKLAAVLRAAEWGPDSAAEGFYCNYCQLPQWHGHSMNCIVGRALAGGAG